MRVMSSRCFPLVLLLAATALTQTEQERFKLTALDGSPGDLLGRAVATDGMTVLVATNGDDDLGTNIGSAFLFDAETGEHLAKILPTPPYSDEFGYSVAVSGDVAAVGDPESRVVHLFEVPSGQPIGQITRPATDFGRSVAIDGDRILIGAHRDFVNGAVTGSAFLFSLSTGQQQFKIVASDGAVGDSFGLSVDLEGDHLVVGAPYTDHGAGTNAGAIYVFDDTGAELVKIAPADLEPDDYFGYDVALSEGRVLAGAPGSITHGVPGRALLHDLAGVRIGELIPTNPGTNHFGFSVALDGWRAVVGRYQIEGGAHLFDVSNLRQVSHLVSSDAQNSDDAGWSVDVAGGVVALGAPDADGVTHDTGAAYVFRAPLGPIGVSLCGPAVPNSTGESGELFAYGSPLAADGNLLLVATSISKNKPGIFLNSMATGSSYPPGSNGHLCLGGAIGRHGLQQATVTGWTSARLDPFELPTPSGSAAVQPGETWYFQYWFRDQHPNWTSNLTDSIAVTFL